jgi:adenylate kinase family enzyme
MVDAEVKNQMESKKYLRLHIFGASGSGVSTLGNALKNLWGIPYFDTDDYFWIPTEPPFVQRREETERNNLLKQNVEQHVSWIVGGSMIHWNICLDANLIIFLWLPPKIRLERLQSREFERYGLSLYIDKNRRQKFEHFLRWAEDYDNNTGIANRTLKAHEEWLNTITQPVLKIIGDVTIEEKILRIMECVKMKSLW